MRKTVLLKIAISLLLTGCGTWLPKVPQHVQYGIHGDINPPGFYGVDNETHARIYRGFSDPNMKGGQCLNAKDYKAFQDWVQAVKQLGEKHCQ